MDFLGVWRVFSAYFTGFLRVHRARKILDVFEGFPWFFKKTKEKKDRGRKADHKFSCLTVC